jgi:hypothetical protein
MLCIDEGDMRTTASTDPNNPHSLPCSLS